MVGELGAGPSLTGSLSPPTLLGPQTLLQVRELQPGVCMQGLWWGQLGPPHLRCFSTKDISLPQFALLH